MYFGNRTIRIHILKGILGFAALYGSLSTMNRTIWPSVILVPVALFFLKGCPMCWTMGLIETLVMAIHKRNERKLHSKSLNSTKEYPPRKKLRLSHLATHNGG